MPDPSVSVIVAFHAPAAQRSNKKKAEETGNQPFAHLLALHYTLSSLYISQVGSKGSYCMRVFVCMRVCTRVCVCLCVSTLICIIKISASENCVPAPTEYLIAECLVLPGLIVPMLPPI